jgi:hypothetical protein
MQEYEHRLPKQGEVFQVTGPDGKTATLKRSGREWCLTWDNPTEGKRARWGNAEQIREDIETFRLVGNIQRSGSRW